MVMASNPSPRRTATGSVSSGRPDARPPATEERDRDTTRLARLVNTAAEQLHSGADVSYGFYFERPSHLSLAVVTCSPNRSNSELDCPVA